MAFRQNSVLMNGDHNSGWHFVKYPFYSDDDPNQLESDYTEIRLPEIIYSLAECKMRNGDLTGAAKLLNSVRKRNYPQENHNNVLYSPEGNARFDEKEMLAEWGREFFAKAVAASISCVSASSIPENGGTKIPMPTIIRRYSPITRSILNSNPDLVQKPGYGR